MPKREALYLMAFFTAFSFSFATYANIRIEPQFIEQDEYFSFLQQEDTVVIDVRTPSEFKAGHIPGAINIPHRDILSGKQNLKKYINKNIVFYCHTGVRVNFVVNYLEKNPSLKPDNIYHLRGDFRGWKARGLEIIKP